MNPEEEMEQIHAALAEARRQYQRALETSGVLGQPVNSPAPLPEPSAELRVLR